MKRAIFVCSGNICRSPMAERIMLHVARLRGEKVAVISMGTLGLRHRPAHGNARAALQEIGISGDGHVSQGLSAGLLSKSDVVFAMEQQHVDAVHRVTGGDAHVVMLGTLDPERGPAEIADPIGQDIDAYRTCRDRLVRCIDAWFDAQAGADHG